MVRYINYARFRVNPSQDESRLILTSSSPSTIELKGACMLGNGRQPAICACYECRLLSVGRKIVAEDLLSFETDILAPFKYVDNNVLSTGSL